MIAPVDRPQTLGVYAGVLLVIIALLAILIASLVTTRANDGRREKLENDLHPFLERTEQFESGAYRLAIEARAYARSDDSIARGRFESALLSFQTIREDLLARGATVDHEDVAMEMIAAADLAIEPISQSVAATDRGESPESRLLFLDASTQLLQTVAIIGERLRAQVEDDIDSTRGDIREAEDRATLVLILSVVTGGVASAIIIWLAVSNRRLVERLSAGTARTSDLIASVPGVVWEAWGQPDQATQRIDFVSDYIEEMLGYKKEEWLTTPNFWLSVVEPSDKERAAAEATAIFTSGVPGQSQFRWVTKDGRVLDVLAYSNVVRDENGRVAGMRGITFDISERLLAERQVRFAAQASSILFGAPDPAEALSAVAQLAVPHVADWCVIHLRGDDGVPYAAAVAHCDPDKIAWARELQDRYPPDPEAVTGAFAVIRRGEAEIVTDIPDAALVEAAVDDEQLRIMREVGLRSYVCAPMIARGRTFGAITFVSTESGRHYDARDLAVAQDIASRAALALDNARLLEAVERERARFESIVDSASLAVYQTDVHGCVLVVNPAGERLLGYTAAELDGKDLHSVVHPVHDDGAEDCPMDRLSISSRRPVTLVDRFTRKDGSQFDVEVSSAPIIVGNRVAGAVGVMQDVTLRLQQDQMKDDFIGFASHELRSPLTTINGMAKWLEKTMSRQGDKFTEDEREAIEALSAGADRMAGIIELFLDLTRIESDRLVIEPTECEFARILQEEADLLMLRSPRASIEVEVDAASSLGFCDAHRLRQVLVNLMDNAVKYGGDPPLVRVGLRVSGNNAVFSVGDNGAGIAAKDRASVFDRFFRGAEAKGKGLGIGLFVSKQIVERLGGTLTFKTGADGTEFLLTVPVDWSSKREPAAADATADATAEAPAPR